MDPTDFLLVAEGCKTSKLEAERRTAAGRSYYAVYNQVVAALSSKGVFFPTRSAHACLIYLTSCKPDLAEDLKRLRNSRNNMQRTFSNANAELAYKTAAFAAASFRQLTDFDLDRITKCIRYLPPFRVNGVDP